MNIQPGQRRIIQEKGRLVLLCRCDERRLKIPVDSAIINVCTYCRWRKP